jgi:uncharacterized membrane protein YesL
VLSGFLAIWRGLRHLNHRGYIYIWANLLWVILSLPIITAPAAWAGLMRLSYTAYRNPSVNLDDFWEGFRENLRRGVVLVVLNGVIIGVNVSNLAHYAGQGGLAVDFMRVVWIMALVIWFTIQLYLWPLFYEMAEPSLWGALRNAAQMIVFNPLFTLALWIGVGVVIVVSTAFMLPWVLLTGGLLAAVANSAVINRLAAAGYTNVPEWNQTNPDYTE